MIFLLLNQYISTYFLSPPLIKMFVQTRTSDSFSLLMNKDHLKHRIRIKLNILPIYKKNVKIDRKQERAKVNSQFSLQTTKSKLNQTGQSRYQTQAKFMRSSQKLKVSRSQSSKNIYDTLSNISSMQEITTKNWCLYDSKSCDYYGFRSDYRRQIASLTKIMTVFISISFFQFFKISLKSKVKITKTAAEMIGTSANLKQDRWVSVQDLLYGTMLPSGNDAAYLLAEYIGYLTLENSRKGTKQNSKNNLNFQSLDLTKENTIGYVQEFVRMMNDKASQMNLINTRFSNPHGLQNALNLSSAKDIVKISLQASNNRLFRKIMNTHYHKYEIFLDDSFKIIETKRWWNTNKLLQNDWQGVKTGHTNSAGSCLSSLKEGIFITVLNCSNMDTRFSDTEEIFRWYRHLKDPSYKLTKIQTQIQSSNDKDRYSNVPTQASI